jgi:membrane protein
MPRSHGNGKKSRLPKNLHQSVKEAQIAALPRSAHPSGVTWTGLKSALRNTYRDVVQHHVVLQAAALSYYFVLSVFPALIFLSAVMGLVPVPDMSRSAISIMSRVLPPDTIRLVQSILSDVLTANRTTAWLSFGGVGMLWAVSAAFDAMIEALDIAYDVVNPRPFWKTRLLAIGLAAMAGGLVLIALIMMILGPRFAAWLANRMDISWSFVFLWPLIHWTVAVVFVLVAVEIMYFLAPRVRQRFLATLPGAVLGVTCWIAFSYLLGFYFRHIANFGRTYGTLSGFIAFMTWFYWNSFALLVGAELNAEVAKVSFEGRLPPKYVAPPPPPSPPESPQAESAQAAEASTS